MRPRLARIAATCLFLLVLCSLTWRATHHVTTPRSQVVFPVIFGLSGRVEVHVNGRLVAALRNTVTSGGLTHARYLLRTGGGGSSDAVDDMVLVLNDGSTEAADSKSVKGPWSSGGTAWYEVDATWWVPKGKVWNVIRIELRWGSNAFAERSVSFKAWPGDRVDVHWTVTVCSENYVTGDGVLLLANLLKTGGGSSNLAVKYVGLDVSNTNMVDEKWKSGTTSIVAYNAYKVTAEWDITAQGKVLKVFLDNSDQTNYFAVANIDDIPLENGDRIVVTWKVVVASS